jgi:hypothetical protein
MIADAKALEKVRQVRSDSPKTWDCLYIPVPYRTGSRRSELEKNASVVYRSGERAGTYFYCYPTAATALGSTH